MTIRELINELNSRIFLDPDFEDYKIVMTGHDALGERKYDIEVKDYTCNPDEGVFRLWEV